jgi:hypothetical protein
VHESILPPHTLVYVTSASPFFGSKGTIRAVDLIGEDGPKPVVFYLVVPHDEPSKELWLESDAVAVVLGAIHVPELS